jgi:hypothetical protein
MTEISPMRDSLEKEPTCYVYPFLQMVKSLASDGSGWAIAGAAAAAALALGCGIWIALGPLTL